MQQLNVLFLCVHNTARSQMAEALLNALCPDFFRAYSAGVTPGELNPLAIEAMREIGIDISNNRTKAVFDLYRQGIPFQYVVALCDEARGERCPVLPGAAKRIDWPFEDPAAVHGPREQQLATMRAVRDAIRNRISAWCKEVCAPSDAARR